VKLEDIKKGTSKYSVMAPRWQGTLLTKKWKNGLIQGKKYIRCNVYSKLLYLRPISQI
jgi:hypothetical protein